MPYVRRLLQRFVARREFQQVCDAAELSVWLFRLGILGHERTPVLSELRNVRDEVASGGGLQDGAGF